MVLKLDQQLQARLLQRDERFAKKPSWIFSEAFEKPKLKTLLSFNSFALQYNYMNLIAIIQINLNLVLYPKSLIKIHFYNIKYVLHLVSEQPNSQNFSL